MNETMKHSEFQAVSFPVSPTTGAVTLEVLASVKGIQAAMATERLLGGQGRHYEWQIKTPSAEHWEHYLLDVRGL